MQDHQQDQDMQKEPTSRWDGGIFKHSGYRAISHFRIQDSGGVSDMTIIIEDDEHLGLGVV